MPSQLELHITPIEAAQLQVALAAYDRLAAGIAPTPEALAAAPVLSDWQRIVVPTPEAALAGRVAGHPVLPGDRRVVTSRLLVLDAAAGWARTLSRTYRLGPPAR